MKIDTRFHDKTMRTPFVSFSVSLCFSIFSTVQFCMSTSCEYLKVFNAIVQCVTIFMVH